MKLYEKQTNRNWKLEETALSGCTNIVRTEWIESNVIYTRISDAAELQILTL